MIVRHNDIQLVITAALKKELPVKWLAYHGMEAHSLAALRSGSLSAHSGSNNGILAVITGVGPDASRDAACWIRDNLNPLYVLNIGTCGLLDRRRAVGRWLVPRFAVDERGDRIRLDTRLPVPVPEKVSVVESLLSVRRAKTGDLPDSCRGYDIVDMECHAQAGLFRGTGISFHCLKFGTDYSNKKTDVDVSRNLELFHDEIKKLFGFIRQGRPAFTTVIPVYNREKTLRRAVDSVLGQSYQSDEVIVVDDSSTDNTARIIESYGQRVRGIRMRENAGPSAARNAGIAASRTEWVAFLDSDDCWEPGKLKGQAEFIMQYPFYQILQSDEKWIRNGRRVNPRYHHLKPAGWIWERSLQRCLVSPSAVIARKSLLLEYSGFDEEMPACEDYDLWLKISRYHPVGLDPSRSVVKYGGHSDQLSTTIEALDRFRVRSLLRLLDNEPDSELRDKISTVLTKKFRVLASGCVKRGRMLRLDINTYKISLC